jgi:hypothetical protein
MSNIVLIGQIAVRLEAGRPADSRDDKNVMAAERE